MAHIYLESTEFRNKSFDMLFPKIIFHNICKIKYLKFAVILFFQAGFLNALFSQSANQNYIVTTVPTSAVGNPTTLTDANSVSTIQYFDGLGRPVETIQKAISGITSNDLVSFTEYDGIGRENKHWLPTLSVGNNGAFVGITDFTSKVATQYGINETPYSTTEYEPSPLNRVNGQLGVGAVWNNPSSPKKVKTEYGTNTLNEVGYYYVNNSNKLQRTGFYAANSLYKTVVTDEDTKTTTEYKDKQERVVMKRNNTNVDTYFVYNDLGQLSFVIPPIAADMLTTDGEITDLTSEILKKYCYLYQYDERGNCIYKRLPGCEPIYMIYDKADRLVFSQDGNQRDLTRKTYIQWTITKYDILGRVLYTGYINREITSTEKENVHNNVVVESKGTTNPFYDTGYTCNPSYITSSDIKPLVVNYYDTYDFIGGLGSLYFVTTLGFDNQYSSAKGLLTGTRTYILDNIGTNYLANALYYDYRGLVVQSRSTNYCGGMDIICNAYYFHGKPSQTLKTHNISGQNSVSERYSYTYDNALRPLITNYYLNGAITPVPLSDNTNGYDELGRLLSRKRHTGGVDTEAYTYNIRNWTTQISSGGFYEKLYYTDFPSGVSGTPCYNGNIAYSIWRASPYTYAYTYTYDEFNRFKFATAYKGFSSPTSACGYSEDFQYDKLGNITYLQRKTGFTLMDYLNIQYNGNQITSVFDYTGSQNSYNIKEYQNKSSSSSATNEMEYDANGNLKKDLDRDIVTIKYNVLNLPDVIQFRTGDKIVNTYDAGGQKLRSDYYTYSLKITLPLTVSVDDINNTVYTPTNYTYSGTAYIENKEYSISKGTTPVNGIYPDIFLFVRMYNTEGYVTNLTSPQYCYYRKDHLGNNHEVWCANTNTTVQRTNYYPSGLPWYDATTIGVSTQAKKFNGKEFVEMDGLDTYDYGARGYYAAIGRFTTIDPLAKKRPWVSPYIYCSGNSVNRIDPDGRIDYNVNSKGYFYQVSPILDKIKRFFGIEDKNDRILLENSNEVISVLPVGSIDKISQNDQKSTKFEIKNNTTAEKVFKDMSRSTNVEWGRVKHSTSNNTSNTLVNDHKEGSVNSLADIALDYLKLGQRIPFFEHSHSEDINVPTWNMQLKVSGQNGDPGDITTAKSFPNTIQRVFNVLTNKYEYYDDKGVYKTEDVGK